MTRKEARGTLHCVQRKEGWNTTMNIKACGCVTLLLCLPAVVEAANFDFVIPLPYKSPDVKAQIIYCTNDRCETVCEQKMKEVMRMADGTLFNRPAYTPPRSFEEGEQRHRDDKAAWEQWDKAMKECVLP